MKKNLLLINLGIATLLLTSCAGNQNTSTAPSPAPSPAASPSPAATPAPSTKPPETVAQAPTTPVIPTVIPPGIEPSTSPQQRLAEVSKGRRDPFGVIPIKPQITILPPEKEETAEGAGGGNGKPVMGKDGKPILGKDGKPIPGSKISGKSPLGGSGKPGEKLPPPLPPEPDIANDVIITGVVELNGIPYAIVQAPQEPFSRYVQSGQYLANGQVLVKKINTYAGNPSVVLEQYGVQVVKQVGEEPPTQDAKATAFVGISSPEN